MHIQLYRVHSQPPIGLYWVNMMIPLQQIIIGMRDMLSKIQGTLTASLFTLLGSYYTLRSLMGAIAQLIITILKNYRRLKNFI